MLELGHTSSESFGKCHSQKLLIVVWERSVVHDVVTPDCDHVDAHPIVLIVPRVEMVFRYARFSLLEGLEE